MTLVIDSTQIDWNNLQTAVDALKTDKTYRQSLNLTLFLIESRCRELGKLYEAGFDPQELYLNVKDEVNGIPVQLGLIILNVLKYAAKEDIDIVDAIEKAVQHV